MNYTDHDGTNFDFTYAPGIASEQIIGFEMAGQIWSSYLTDDVTVRIHVESTDELPENIVGAAMPGKNKKVDYDKLWKKMSEDITSSEDLLAFNNLPSTEKEFSVLIDGVELDKTKEFKLTNANAKALDLLNDNHKKLDGHIIVNDLSGSSTVGWDYDALRSDTISDDAIDFLSMAIHEVGHVLGFVSGIDDDGWLKILTESREKGKEIKDSDFKFATPLDLFRYSEESAARGEIDISTGGNPFFSLDGGNTKLGDFANGEHSEFGGDGYQASHWKQDSSQGVMNPVLPFGERKEVSALDITAMDVMGWNVNSSVSLDWNDVYNSAIASSQTAMIEDRSKDVEKMIKESNKYKGIHWFGSKGFGSRGYRYFWQAGLFQQIGYKFMEASEEIQEINLEEGTAQLHLQTNNLVEESVADVFSNIDNFYEEVDSQEKALEVEQNIFVTINKDLENTEIIFDKQNNQTWLLKKIFEPIEVKNVFSDSWLLSDVMKT